MLNTRSVQAVTDATFSERFVQPLYDSYCFANFPSTIQYLLTGQGQSTLPLDVFGNFPTNYKKVVFLFIDAFGWRFFERYADKYDFLKIALEQGVVSKLTSQFPSTTAAHVTCMHTGLNVGQSGIYEWNYYEPLVDAIISPLLFSFGEDKLTRDTLKPTGVPPVAFYPTQTLYKTLQTQGVQSHILQYKAYTPSTYSDIVFAGARTHPYNSIEEAFFFLAELLAVKTTAPAYYFLYFDRIDAACHNYGPYAKQFEEAVNTFLNALQRLFYEQVAGKVQDTLLLLSADHGQVEVDPATTFYLNKRIPGIERYLHTNRQGQLLVPAGSARDMFLYVKEEYIEEAITTLQQHLTGRAEVYRVHDLLAQGFFGVQEPAATLLARLGNVVILPYQHESVWWYKENSMNMHFKGHHGGLTREEMEIPLLVVPL